MDSKAINQPDGRPPKDPVHEEWDFCTRGYCEQRFIPGFGQSKTVVNIYPLATKLRKWLLRENAELPLFTKDEGEYRNPFTLHTSFLVHIFTRVVNGFGDFIKQRDPLFSEVWEIDLQRMRYSSELTLYTVRICEGLLKQLLFCTQIDPKRYWHVPLGGLLSQKCRACKGHKKHWVSLAGSLAHRYKLCGQYEQCLRRDLGYLNELRNSQAAHATVGDLELSSSVEEAWDEAELYCQEIGDKFVHMLEHISEIELAMIDELTQKLHSEDKDGRYNSNLLSTYYWEVEYTRLCELLYERISLL